MKNYNQIVRKSNFLVEASYRLSAIEQKIILTLAGSIRPDDKEFEEYSFQVKNLVSLLGIKPTNEYKFLKGVTKDLLKRVLVLKTDEKILQTHWVSSATYIEGKGTVELCFDPKLKPFLLELKNRFTNYPLKYALKLKSQYSIRIYELLKQYEKIGQRLFEVSELRSMLGIDKEQYAQYADFRKRVILSAQDELAEKTDISFRFEEIKVGHGIGRIRFFINIKPREEIAMGDNVGNRAGSVSQNSPDAAELEKLIALLPEEYRNKESVKKLLKTWLLVADFNYVARNIECSNECSNAVKPGVKTLRGSNYRAYLSKALKGDFGLSYKEDKEAKMRAELEVKQRQKEDIDLKKAIDEKMKKEKDEIERIKQYRKALAPELLDQIRDEAIERMSPQHREMLRNKSIGSDILLKITMDQILLEKMRNNP